MKQPKGVSFRPTRAGWPVMRIHYTADPSRDENWKNRELPSYRSKALWDQEQEIRYSAGGGERLLRELLLDRFDEIVIRDQKKWGGWFPQENWTYGAGFDYGKAKPTSFHVNARDHAGIDYALCEHYRSGTDWTPWRHVRAMSGLTIHFENRSAPVFEKVKRIWADPRVMDAVHAQAGDNEYKSTAELYLDAFVEAGLEDVRMSGGLRGDDIGFIDRLLTMWQAPDPQYKIVLKPGMQYNRKMEGTFSDGCPNLVWELLGIKRAEMSATQSANKAPSESIVQKNNHAFDDQKYYFSSKPRSAVYTNEERWARQTDQFLKENPGISDLSAINSQIWNRKEFDKANEPKVEKWH